MACPSTRLSPSAAARSGAPLSQVQFASRRTKVRASRGMQLSAWRALTLSHRCRVTTWPSRIGLPASSMPSADGRTSSFSRMSALSTTTAGR